MLKTELLNKRPSNLVKRFFDLAAVFAASALLSFPAHSAEERISISDAITSVESSMLRACVQSSVSGISFADELTRLECREESDSDYIDSLAGLEQFSGLTVLSIEWGKLSDVSPIGELIKLEQLVLDNGDYGQDFSPLTSLINLQSLRIEIETGDLDWLTSLSTLSELHLTAFLPGGGEPTLDLNTLAGLINLEVLGIYHGRYTDLTPIANLSKLRWLRFANADIQNWEPITSLQMLEELWVYARGYYFDLSLLNEFPLLNAAQIATSYEGILEDLVELPPDLVHFGIWYSNVTDFSWVSRLTKLKTLHLGGNEETKIPDLSDLASIDYLESLDLWYGNFQKLGTAFDTWRNGTVIQATGNPLTCADLARARENASITIIFDSECLPSGDSDTGGVEGTIDSFRHQRPYTEEFFTSPLTNYYYALSRERKTVPFELSSTTHYLEGTSVCCESSFYIYEGDEAQLVRFNDGEEQVILEGPAGSRDLSMGPAPNPLIAKMSLNLTGKVGQQNRIYLTLGEDKGETVGEVVQQSEYLKITRPLSGTAGEGKQCVSQDMSGFANQIYENGQVKLFFDDLIGDDGFAVFENWYRRDEGGRRENTFQICPESPPGIYQIDVTALDGVGGKRTFDLAVVISQKRVAGGSVEWLPLGSAPQDPDGDGVESDEDAFPEDAAASVDTDGDGKPDDWNQGYSSSDSTSTPQLILDDDDDNDGILDRLDAFPMDAAASVDEDGDGKPDVWNEGKSASDSTSLPTLVLDDVVDELMGLDINDYSYFTEITSNNSGNIKNHRYYYALKTERVRYPYNLADGKHQRSGRSGSCNICLYFYKSNEKVALDFSDNSPEAENERDQIFFSEGPPYLDLSRGPERNSDVSTYAYQSDNNRDRIAIDFTEDRGASALDVQQKSAYLRIWRPTWEAVGEAGQTCFYPDFDGFSDQISRLGQVQLFFSNLIQGGSLPVFGTVVPVLGEAGLGAELRKENGFRMCPGTPPGEYPLEITALDGVGGKKSFDFTVEIMEERIGSGKVEWFPLGASPAETVGDRDGDGVPDEDDAFPDDPAASRDTDQDGQPDDWNPGFSQSDSTSTPALQIDDDDDDDGASDEIDAYPYDWQRSELEGEAAPECLSDYCTVMSASPGSVLIYHYRVGEEAKNFEFLHGGENWLVESGGGSNMNFEFYDGESWISLRDSGGEILSSSLDALANLFSESSGSVTLRLPPDSSVGWVALNLVKPGQPTQVSIFVMSDDGYRLETFEQTARLVEFERPSFGTGNHRNSEQCSTYDYRDMGLPEFNPFSFNLMSPSRLIPIGNLARDWNLRLPGTEIFICADTPPGIYDLTYEVVDGAGGKTAFPLTISIKEERVDGGRATWSEPSLSDEACEHAHCLEVVGQRQYYYTFNQQPMYFPAERPFEVAARATGAVNYEFNLHNLANQDLQSVVIGSSLEEPSRAALTEALNGERYHLFRASQSATQQGDWVYVEDNSLRQILLGRDRKARVDNLVQSNAFVRVSPPTPNSGAGWAGGSQCARFASTDLAKDLGSYYVAFEGAFPESQHINPMGAAYEGESFFFCEDLTTGLFETKVAIVDGRGGKLLWPLTIQVMEEQVVGGSVEWFRNKAAAGVVSGGTDRDGDGVPNDRDAFPDDPAASVDTDGDGYPDEWNAGKSEADSTSSPVLALDAFPSNPTEFKDSDGDGVGDNQDQYPNDASKVFIPYDEVIASIPDSRLRACVEIAYEESDEAWPLTGLLCSEESISTLEGLELLSSLEELRLDGTSIKQLERISGLSYLKVLSVVRNDLSSLEFVKDLVRLEELYLEQGTITDISPLRNLSSLRKLDFQGHSVIDLTPLTGLKSLQELKIDFNPINDISPLLGLSNLHTLGLAKISVDDFSSLAQLKNLRWLRLDQNNIASFDFILQLPLLNNTGLNDTGLNDDALALIAQKRWIALGIGGNNITNLSPVEDQSDLYFLIVDRNSITSLTPLSDLKNLRILYARELGIEQLEGLQSLVDLERLELGSNEISDITALKSVSKLQILNLKDNRISRLGDTFDSWAGPTQINLSNNPLTCGDISAASQNQNIQITFDSECEVSTDEDGDGVADEVDAFPSDPAASVDTDADGRPDDWNEGKSATDSTSDPALVLDDDDDGDGVLDVDDAYPLDPERTIFDDDLDGVANTADNCPVNANADQFDLDGDGLGDACDDNRDGDQCPDAEDAYPSDPRRCELGVQKAIVVAGGGPYPSNFLWEATERMAELSIKTLKGQGIAEENIRYLSAGFGDQFLPQGPATEEAIRDALLNWTLDADSPADDVLLYLVDHGGPEVFELAKKEQLAAQDLDSWLDELQAELPGQLTVVYDACQSGTFVPIIAPTGEQSRLVMASSGPNERAHFASKGDVSFSFHFWSNFLIGGDIYRAFVASDNAMSTIFDRKQNAEIEVDGDGIPNKKSDKTLAQSFSFGLGVALASDVPQVGRVTGPLALNGERKVTVEAFDVTGATEIFRVWALIETPDEIELPVDEPLTNIALLEFEPSLTDGTWRADFTGIDIQGTYELQVFAENVDGQYSVPPPDGSNKIVVIQKSGRVPKVGRDSDQDGVLDQSDPFPLDPRYQRDQDRDLIPDVIDADANGDGRRDDYQGKDIFEWPEGSGLAGYLIQDGGEISGTFHTEDDIDRYAIFGIAGEQLRVSVFASADAQDGPDHILSIVDEAGVVRVLDGKKLTVDDNLQGQGEELEFIVPSTGQYWVEVSQAKLAGTKPYVIGAQSEYALLLDSDRSEFAAVDLGVELEGLRDRAESLAWQQPFGAELEEGSAFQGSWYLMLPRDVTPIGFDANQCAYSDQVLQCAADSGQSVSVQLLAEASGVREIALYGVQEGSDGSPLKEINATNNLKVLRFNVSEDSDQDSLPDDYERNRGLVVGIDDALADIDQDGLSNIDEYLSGVNPLDFDVDADLDGVRDDVDAFPENPREWLDTDGDGIGNNADDDDDDDGTLDAIELIDGTDPLDRFSCKTGCFSFDVDANLETKPLTDGLLVIRYLFGFDGSALIDGAVGEAADRSSAESLADYLDRVRDGLDIDGDGEPRALTDGLLLIRYLFGFRDEALISGAVGDGATRRSAEEIDAYISKRLQGG